MIKQSHAAIFTTLIKTLLRSMLMELFQDEHYFSNKHFDPYHLDTEINIQTQ